MCGCAGSAVCGVHSPRHGAAARRCERASEPLLHQAVFDQQAPHAHRGSPGLTFAVSHCGVPAEFNRCLVRGDGGRPRAQGGASLVRSVHARIGARGGAHAQRAAVLLQRAAERALQLTLRACCPRRECTLLQPPSVMPDSLLTCTFSDLCLLRQAQEAARHQLRGLSLIATGR